jgi:hypothetical protein
MLAGGGVNERNNQPHLYLNAVSGGGILKRRESNQLASKWRMYLILQQLAGISRGRPSVAWPWRQPVVAGGIVAVGVWRGINHGLAIGIRIRPGDSHGWPPLGIGPAYWWRRPRPIAAYRIHTSS